MELEQDFGLREVLFQKLTPSLVLERKCQELVARCSAAVLEVGVRTMSLEQERALDIVLRTFETQAADLEAGTCLSNTSLPQGEARDAHFHLAYDRFQTKTCCLSIQILHFFKTQTLYSTNCLGRLLNTACSAVEYVQDLNREAISLAATPLEVYFGMLLASVTLLRIHKGAPMPGLDLEKARSRFFAAINLLKQMSVQNNDGAAKTVLVLNQLWNSTKAFRKSDGSDFTTLRIRSRLMLSPVVDAVWWWREEYDPQFRSGGPTQGNMPDGMFSYYFRPLIRWKLIIGIGVDINRDNMATAPIGVTERHEPILFNDQFLADFEWALVDDELFPSTEPYGSGWSSVGAPM